MRQILVILAVIILIFFGGIVIFAIPWGGSGENQEVKQQKVLTDFADSNTKVVMNVRGKVNNNKEHRQLEITVGKSAVSATIYRGYQKTVLKTYDANNNVDAYQVFLSALLNAGYTSRQEDQKGVSKSGACYYGQIYDFEIIDNGFSEDIPKSSWAGSCSKKIGTFAGNISAVRSLFQAQIVDYNDFTAGTEF